MFSVLAYIVLCSCLNSRTSQQLMMIHSCINFLNRLPSCLMNLSASSAFTCISVTEVRRSMVIGVKGRGGFKRNFSAIPIHQHKSCYDHTLIKNPYVLYFFPSKPRVAQKVAWLQYVYLDCNMLETRTCVLK